MTTFDEREQAFEAKFEHDNTVQFLLTAKRDKLFALWAADELTLSEGARAELTHAVLKIANDSGHDRRLMDLIAARFTDQGRIAHDDTLVEVLARCHSQAQQQMQADPHRTIDAG